MLLEVNVLRTRSGDCRSTAEGPGLRRVMVGVFVLKQRLRWEVSELWWSCSGWKDLLELI